MQIVRGEKLLQLDTILVIRGKTSAVAWPAQFIAKSSCTSYVQKHFDIHVLSRWQLEYLIEELRIQGFHVYQDNRTPIFGERKNEPGINMLIAVCKGGNIASFQKYFDHICLQYLFGMVELIIYYKVLKLCHFNRNTLL